MSKKATMATALKLPVAPDERARSLLDYNGELVFQLRPGENPDKLYRRICALYEDRSKIEQDEEGDVHVIAPTGGESGTQKAEAVADLVVWARQDGRGKAFDSSTTFVLTKRLKLVPDAAWASKERIYAVPYEQRTGYIPIIPQFVIEIWSKTDRYAKLQEKMQRYLSCGVELGWLIHPKLREVKVYTQEDVVTFENPKKLRGTGPIKGFTLNLEPTWLGLGDEPKSRPVRKKS